MDTMNLTRDCEVVRIPAGDIVTLPAGTEVFISQSLGGSFTVQSPSYGGLFRIAGHDADALGKEVPEEAQLAADPSAPLEERVAAALRTCFDPEIPVNIVDLGLVYHTAIMDSGDGTSTVEIKMTLTAQGCGMGAAIAADAASKLRRLDGVTDANVDIVWDPPWGPQMISDEGKKTLGFD
jgi:probable FeS assembly SUF system protein SufT